MIKHQYNCNILYSAGGPSSEKEHHTLNIVGAISLLIFLFNAMKEFVSL